jgi:hypothetical protein
MLPSKTQFSLLDASTKYDYLSSIIWDAELESYPHPTQSTSTSPKHKSCPMNRWYDEECKSLHHQLQQAFTHAHPSYLGLKVLYCRLLRRKKNLFISQRRYDLSISLTHSPKNLWRTILPCRSPLPSDLDLDSMFSHISTLYDIPGQAQIQVTSPPSSCYLFSNKDIKEAILVMNSSR